MKRWLAAWLLPIGLLHPPAAPAADGPARSGIDLEYVKPEVRAQDDLFRHVNGKFLDDSPIPADRPLDGAFYKLRDLSEARIRAIIEESAGKAGGDEATRKVGDLFAGFMDESKIEAMGAGPLKDRLARIAAIADKPGLIRAFARLSREGVDVPFSAGVNTDAKQSDRYIVTLGQAGLGLPDESYYRLDKFRKVLDAYKVHVRKMFELAGLPDPAGSADRVVALETALAKANWDRVKSRDDTLTYNKMDRAALASATPGFDWDAWYAALGIRPLDEVIVSQPSYFAAMAGSVGSTPLPAWKDYLAWSLIRNLAPYLSRPFVEENFEFYIKTLSGATELKPRWKRGVAAVESALGEVVGKLYVDRHFPPASKARMLVLVGNLTEAYRQDIKGLEWMGPETKAKALAKLDRFNPKIGYTEKWRDYGPLTIVRDDLVGNMERSAAFEFDRGIAKLGKPVDRAEWFMTPQTVNAYYNPGMNEIVFPAAILQPPFFDPDADDAVNYGGIGAVIGHEIGHGFDDQGSKYDGDGNMQDWWTDADRKEFDARSKKLIGQYDAYEPKQLKDQHVNGALTIGENIGDLGGLTIGYKAYQLALAGKPAPVLDGLTGDQRFFTGWAQVWRAKYRDAEMVRRLATDPHSPAEFRCNGTIRNVPAFYDAFGIKPGDKLYLAPDQRVTIW